MAVCHPLRLPSGSSKALRSAPGALDQWTISGPAGQAPQRNPGDRDKALEAAAAWDAFGAMWVLSQRAMRRVAMDLAAQQGVSETEVVARAMQCANEVLNGDGVDLGGTIAAAQMEHIARHRPYLRKQFRQG
jgi:hypothetical protein